jgi:hypothetical protein
MAQATTWVKLTFPLPAVSLCLLMIRRFSSSVRTGISRMEVAVGRARLASMFSTTRSAPPRMGWAMSPGRIGASAMARRAAGLCAGSERAIAVPASGSTAASGAAAGRAAGGASAGRPVIRSK